MKNFLLLVLCVWLCSSCSTLPSVAGRDLATKIATHSFSRKRAVILGDGVSAETAVRTSQTTGAMVLYCPSRGPVAEAGKQGRAALAGPSSFMRDVLVSLRAMAASGDAWEIAVADRARGQLRVVLKAMRFKELASFQGRLVLSEASLSDQPFQDQLKRVFGEGVSIEYVSRAEP